MDDRPLHFVRKSLWRARRQPPTSPTLSQGWAARSKAASKKAAKKSAKKAAAAAAASNPADGAANGAATAKAGAAADVGTQLAEFRDTAVGALASLEAVVRERLAQPLREQVQWLAAQATRGRACAHVLSAWTLRCCPLIVSEFASSAALADGIVLEPRCSPDLPLCRFSSACCRFTGGGGGGAGGHAVCGAA